MDQPLIEPAPSAPAIRKGQTDTAEGCRTLARGNRAEAELSLVPNLRRRLENSAATWDARAVLLARLDTQRAARTSAA